MGQQLSQLFQLVTDIHRGPTFPYVASADSVESGLVGAEVNMDPSNSIESPVSSGMSKDDDQESLLYPHTGEREKTVIRCQHCNENESSGSCASDRIEIGMCTEAPAVQFQPTPGSSGSMHANIPSISSNHSASHSPPRKRLLPLHHSRVDNPKHPRIHVCSKGQVLHKTSALTEPAATESDTSPTFIHSVCAKDDQENKLTNLCGWSVPGEDRIRTTIDDMPPHILLQVFDFLPLTDLLLRASLVCKRWYDLAHDPDLWRIISLKGHMKVTDEALVHMTSLSDNVTELDISDSRFISSEGFERALEQCQQLQSLLLISCQHLSEKAFQAIGRVCHQLMKLRLECCFGLTDPALSQIAGGCPKLEVLRLDHCCQVSDVGLRAVARSCHQLRYLSLDQCTKVTDQCLADIVEGCPKLHTFSGMSCTFTDEGLTVLTGLSELKILELANIRALNGTGVRNIVKSCRKLESLNISLCRKIDDPCVDYIARNAPLIHSLSLVSCNLTDKSLVSLSVHCKHLRKLDVGWCSSITDEGVLLMSETCRSLVYFGLMRCDQVTIPTTEMLVSRYPRITYSTMWLDCKRLLEQAQQEGHLSDINIPTLMNSARVPS